MSINQDRTLDKVNPVVRKRFLEAEKEFKSKGYNFEITESYRTVERQQYLYDKGITPCKGTEMESYHQWGLAIDLHHNEADNLYPEEEFEEVAKIMKKHGFAWGGDWKSVDTPHFEMTFGLTIKELKQGAKPPESDTLEIEIHNGKSKEVVECRYINKSYTNYVPIRDIECRWLKVDYVNGKVILSIYPD